MFVNRTATGSAGAIERFQPDVRRRRARWASANYFRTSGFAARTETPGLAGRDYAYNIDSE